MSRLMTVQADDAQAAAFRDRVAHVDMLLDVACKDALKLLQRGRPGMARYRLARAEVAARRILGTAGSRGGAR